MLEQWWAVCNRYKCRCRTIKLVWIKSTDYAEPDSKVACVGPWSSRSMSDGDSAQQPEASHHTSHNIRPNSHEQPTRNVRRQIDR